MRTKCSNRAQESDTELQSHQLVNRLSNLEKHLQRNSEIAKAYQDTINIMNHGSGS